MGELYSPENLQRSIQRLNIAMKPTLRVQVSSDASGEPIRNPTWPDVTAVFYQPRFIKGVCKRYSKSRTPRRCINTTISLVSVEWLQRVSGRLTKANNNRESSTLQPRCLMRFAQTRARKKTVARAARAELSIRSSRRPLDPALSSNSSWCVV